MKNIIKTLFVLILLVNVSCDSEPDNLMSDAKEGGAIVKILPSDGKALGMPIDANDIDNTSVNFTDINLDLNIGLQFGGHEVTKYEIVKSFVSNNTGEKTEEVVVASGATLPLNVTYTTIEEYMNGTGISDSNQLHIGDQFIFKTKMYTNSGEVHYAKEGTYSVAINCSSNLAGPYVMHFLSGDTFITITETSPGNYKSNYFPTFSSSYWFEFSDTCSKLMITDWQFQGGNPISPIEEEVGYVDEDGNLVFEGLNVGGVSWYVDRSFTIFKN